MAPFFIIYLIRKTNMENYQLYRTNVLLGGQMQYDLILNHEDITDFHISPISDKVAYNHHIVDNPLNNSHQENIKEFYKKTASFFYKDFANPQLTSLYPLPKQYKGETSDTTYEMGIKWTNKRSLYKKDFEFFCPLWLEKIENGISDLIFRFTLLTDKEIISKDIKIEYGSKLQEYFDRYIESIELNRGCDWVFNINKNTNVVSGLNVNTGLPVVKKIFNLYDNLTYRERPLLEFNNLIINELNNNSLITRQLFNFNFCFNLEDLFGNVLCNLIPENIYENNYAYEKLKISLKVFYKGEKLEVMDIFSNHQIIPKIDITPKLISTTQNINTDNSNDINVLDHLLDYKCIDLINKNKIIQNTCHWQLSNSKLHFNTYEGFSPILESSHNDENKTFIQYISEDVVNITSDNFNICNNNYWCNIYETNSINDIVEIESDLNYFSKFNSDCWVKGVKYKYNKDINDIYILCTITQVSTETVGGILPIPLKGKWIDHGSKNNVRILISIAKPRRIILLINDHSKIHYKNIINIGSSLNGNKTWENFFNIFSSSRQQLESISIQRDLQPRRADGPSMDTDEIEYYKHKANKILLRYFGYIRPYFIKTNGDRYYNIKWYKPFNNDEILNSYAIHNQKKYSPLYPSIDYFPLQWEREKYENLTTGWVLQNNKK
jgi:hypothetical protein